VVLQTLVLNCKKISKLLIETGIVGINLEDSDKKNNIIFPIELQCERINVIKKVGAQTGIPIFLNVRTDVYFRERILRVKKKNIMKS
jgi:2-methylisocitrate lyase-like PEP mutase family enzyme